MTPFNKNRFKWDGMYLMYGTNLGNQAFIARFKYGSKPYRKWINFLCKNFYIEEYLELAKQTSPRDAIESKGYVDKMTIAGMKATIKVQKEIINTLNKELEAVK